MKRLASVLVLLSLSVSTAVGAATLTLQGTLGIAAGTKMTEVDPVTGEAYSVYASGSYFAMGANNPNGTAAMLSPGAAGGITLGEYQSFVLDPDEPHPYNWDGAGASAGTGYGSTPTVSSTIVDTFSFFGTPTYVGTNPVAYQSGEAHPAPTAVVDLDNCTGTVCAMSVELSAWEVMWNGSAFEQGPRPDNTGPFVLAEGSFDTASNFYSLYWVSQIKGGPFNGVSGHWYLEGTFAPVPLPAPLLLLISGLAGLLLMRKKGGYLAA